MNTPFGTGANISPADPRTVAHHDLVMAGEPLTKGGIPYEVPSIDNQHYVGICTAISLTQNRQKANGRKYSPDFQYLLQKKYYDLNWNEGSSIFYALKVGKSIGFLPAELWTYTTEADRSLSYSQYIAKLSAIPDLEVLRLIQLCVDKIPGYASIDVTAPQRVAQAINDSEAGILCMYRVGKEWYTPSWLTADIDPIKPPAIVTSGHAINMSEFDFTSGSPVWKLPNTWGTVWNIQGQCHINYDKYKMQEAWSILKTAPVVPPYQFNHNLWFGHSDPDNIPLQSRLGVSPTDINFGPKTLAAVIAYQKANGITPTGFVGPLTRAALNSN